MHIEIERIDAFLAHLRDHSGLRSVVVQGLDLRGHADALDSISGEDSVFLGCHLPPRAAEHLRETGAVLFPALAERPYHPYRARLYTAEELLEGTDMDRPASFWETSRDAAIYAYYQRHRGGSTPHLLEALGQRLHDHAIDDAKHDLLRDETRRRPVAVMGGHAMRRDEADYATVVRLARRIAQEGYFLVSGGGPGAMEATHLGAWLAPHPDAAVQEALDVVRAAPTYKHPDWLATALEVKARWPSEVESLAIPTWFYGHEPTNLFASHVAKYFSNSLREDGLLAIATHGVIYAPGSAGTVQEVFMDTAQNHYGTFDVVSPMVFLGVDYWTRQRPVRELLRSLSEGRQYASRIGYVDEVEEALAFLVANPPVPYEG